MLWMKCSPHSSSSLRGPSFGLLCPSRLAICCAADCAAWIPCAKDLFIFEKKLLTESPMVLKRLSFHVFNFCCISSIHFVIALLVGPLLSKKPLRFFWRSSVHCFMPSLHLDMVPLKFANPSSMFFVIPRMVVLTVSSNDT